jgi:hypothetical protein
VVQTRVLSFQVAHITSDGHGLALWLVVLRINLFSGSILGPCEKHDVHILYIVIIRKRYGIGLVC